MGFEAQFIIALQNLSNTFLDYLNLGFTLLGEEIFFLIAAVLLYWCYDKRYAFRFFNIYIVSVALNEGIKMLVKRPRPFDGYTNIYSIGEKTPGYSFPSGHSQSIANISTQIFLKFKTRLILILAISVTVIVMMTRMYLGQHYLTDVLAGAALGIGLAVGLNFLFELLGQKEHYIAYALVPICIILTIILVALNAQAENIFKVLGGYTAFGIGYVLEKKFVKFDVRSVKWYKNLIKLGVGLSVTLLLKEGLKFILPESNLFLYAYLRYFLVAAWASIGAMAVFKVLKL